MYDTMNSNAQLYFNLLNNVRDLSSYVRSTVFVDLSNVTMIRHSSDLLVNMLNNFDNNLYTFSTCIGNVNTVSTSTNALNYYKLYSMMHNDARNLAYCFKTPLYSDLSNVTIIPYNSNTMINLTNSLENSMRQFSTCIGNAEPSRSTMSSLSTVVSTCITYTTTTTYNGYSGNVFYSGNMSVSSNYYG